MLLDSLGLIKVHKERSKFLYASHKYGKANLFYKLYKRSHDLNFLRIAQELALSLWEFFEIPNWEALLDFFQSKVSHR